MKICTIANPKSIHVKRYCEYFVKRGHEIHILHFVGPRSEYEDIDIENVNVWRIKTVQFMFLRPFKAIQCSKAVKKIKPDILHSQQVIFEGWHGALSGFHPFVVSAWGSDIAVMPTVSKGYNARIKFTLKRADRVQCGDPASKSRLLELGCPEEKIFYAIGGGVNTEVFSPEKRSRELREVWSAQEKTVVLCVRWLKPLYGVDTLINAAPHVIKVLPSVLFVIVGEGELKDSLIKRAGDLGLEGYFKFAGKIDHKEMPEYLASADIYVDTWHTNTGGGGVGQTFYEAMSSGLPTVNAAKPGADEVTKHGYNGYIFKGGNHKELANYIVSLAREKDKRKLFGDRNREIAKERFEEKVLMRKLEALFEEMTKK